MGSSCGLSVGTIGISCFYHDSAVSLIDDEGNIIAAVQEERFTRLKHDARFPLCSLAYCINLAKKQGIDITAYVYYEKPVRVFLRLIETYLKCAPRGFSSFFPAMQSWLSEKLFMSDKIEECIGVLDDKFNPNKLYFSDHHLSHASAAFFPSPYEEAAVLCMDAVGEFATTTVWHGKGNKLTQLWKIDFPCSIGLLYSAFTYYCGFKVNSGEYKLMGLAPYGRPKYTKIILDNVVHLLDDGTFKLNLRYFKYHRGLKMISSNFYELFNGRKERNPDEPLTRFYADIAASIQEVTELIVSRLARTIRAETGLPNLCLSGGVALNCVANGKLIKSKLFDSVWIQPASGDAGSSLGAALSYFYVDQNSHRVVQSPDSMKYAYLGVEFSDDDIKDFLQKLNIPHNYCQSDNELVDKVSSLLIDGKVIGWFQGKMEFGPRALGNRSILGDPRNKNMQQVMNLKIKKRESFRPFAPAILDGYQQEYFNLCDSSPYMLIATDLASDYLVESPDCNVEGDIALSDDAPIESSMLNSSRSSIPAVTHVNGTCRIQTVTPHSNPQFHKLLKNFHEKTGCPALINTSFNVRGEPIVATPEDALRCLMYTEIDCLAVGHYLVFKQNLSQGLKSDILEPFFTED